MTHSKTATPKKSCKFEVAAASIPVPCYSHEYHCGSVANDKADALPYKIATLHGQYRGLQLRYQTFELPELTPGKHYRITIEELAELTEPATPDEPK